jgi:hypothetical protein
MLIKYVRLTVLAFALPGIFVSACAATPRATPLAGTSVSVSASAPAPIASDTATTTPTALGSGIPTATSTPTALPAVGDADAIRACSTELTTAAKANPNGPTSTVRAGYDTTIGAYHRFLSAISVADGSQANQAWAADTDSTPVVECVWDGSFIGPGDPGTYSRAIGIVTPAGNSIAGSAAAFGTSTDVDSGWLARP